MIKKENDDCSPNWTSQFINHKSYINQFWTIIIVYFIIIIIIIRTILFICRMQSLFCFRFLQTFVVDDDDDHQQGGQLASSSTRSVVDILGYRRRSKRFILFIFKTSVMLYLSLIPFTLEYFAHRRFLCKIVTRFMIDFLQLRISIIAI